MRVGSRQGSLWAARHAASTDGGLVVGLLSVRLSRPLRVGSTATMGQPPFGVEGTSN